jgi:hypothetical protein
MRIAQSKVDDFDQKALWGVLQEQVLGLEVAVCDLVAMQLLDTIQDLVEEFASLSLRDMSVSHDVIEHFAPISVLHHEVDRVWCVQDLVELDDVCVPRLLQDLDLSIHSPHISLVLNSFLF